MGIVIAIINQKGGVGKSTTAQAIGAGLELQKNKVLLLDMDSQSNLSYITGAEADGPSVMDVLKHDATIKEAIEQASGGLIVPAGNDLAGADLQLSFTGKEYRLREALEPVKKDFDYIIIDTPPALGILTINALTAADYVVIPAQADILSLQGIGQLNGTIEAVKKYCNHNLQVAGILITRYSKRSVLNRDMRKMIDDTAQAIGTKAFKTAIRDTVAIREAQASRKDIFTYAPKSNAAADYSDLIKELLQRIKKA